MPRPMNEEEKKEAIERAQEWQRFRQANMLSQRTLGDVIGISRRTIQQIEAGLVLPHKATLAAYNALVEKYRAEGKHDGKNKSK